MKDRLFQALKCSIGMAPYGDFPADDNIGQEPTRTPRDITDALVTKAKSGDTQAIALILQIAEFEPKEQ